MFLSFLLREVFMITVSRICKIYQTKAFILKNANMITEISSDLLKQKKNSGDNIKAI